MIRRATAASAHLIWLAAVAAGILMIAVYGGGMR